MHNFLRIVNPGSQVYWRFRLLRIKLEGVLFRRQMFLLNWLLLGLLFVIGRAYLNFPPFWIRFCTFTYGGIFLGVLLWTWFRSVTGRITAEIDGAKRELTSGELFIVCRLLDAEHMGIERFTAAAGPSSDKGPMLTFYFLDADGERQTLHMIPAAMVSHIEKALITLTKPACTERLSKGRILKLNLAPSRSLEWQVTINSPRGEFEFLKTVSH